MHICRVGTLYLVATPIGHLDDLSFRAKAVLECVDTVVCEDTRVTRKLLAAYEIETPLGQHHAHSSDKSVEAWVDRLRQGQTLAYVSDAGTPLISDPGASLVEAALAAEQTVVPVPGASAVTCALMGSGLPAQPYVFLGFLPRKEAEQREILSVYIRLPVTLVIYEAPSRVKKTLELLSSLCGSDRPACVARELTKRYEQFHRGALSTLIPQFDSPRGEMVVMVGPPSQGVEKEAELEAAMAREARKLVLAGTSPSEAAKTLAAALGVPRKLAYRALLDAQQRGPNPDA